MSWQYAYHSDNVSSINQLNRTAFSGNKALYTFNFEVDCFRWIYYDCRQIGHVVKHTRGHIRESVFKRLTPAVTLHIRCMI